MSHLNYTFGWDKANTQIIRISFEINNNTEEILELRLPSWRPGRYEIANFAKNIISIEAKDDSGKLLALKKIAKDVWMLACGTNKKITINYKYYAAELNAGSTWLDENQLYVNPVNCCLFIPNRIDENCAITINIPDDYQIAIDVHTEKKNYFQFSSYDRLADTPFIASPDIEHLDFEEQGHHFHLWFQGALNIPKNKLITDFRCFAAEQLKTMKALPGKEYHFLFQILPHSYYHGVEHTFSTVCALGPAINVFESPLYDEFLGVSSHELFHAWNVKTIRPNDMAPYRFSEENYSSLGWVYEGVTTWYGDMFLFRSGVFDENRFLNTFNEKLNRHFGNYGRFNLSVAESSFDTWLDGYVAGAPNRKTSIYTEGSLLTFILDSRIRDYSNDARSFDDLLLILFEDAKNNKPYSRQRLIEILDDLAPLNHDEFFITYIEGTGNYEPLLINALSRIGLQLNEKAILSVLEHQIGVKLKLNEEKAEVTLIAPNSPAELSGLMIGDEIIAINSMKFNYAFRKDLFFTDPVKLHAFSQGRLKSFELNIGEKKYFVSREIKFLADASSKQKQAYKNWSKRDFPPTQIIL